MKCIRKGEGDEEEDHVEYRITDLKTTEPTTWTVSLLS